MSDHAVTPAPQPPEPTEDPPFTPENPTTPEEPPHPPGLSPQPDTGIIPVDIPKGV